MGTPWGYGPQTFQIDGAVATLVKLRVPHRGTLQAISLEQVGGVDAGHFQIFDSETAAKVVAEDVVGSASLPSSVSSAGLPGLDPAVSDIMQGPIAITSGRYQAKDLNIRYRNRDGSYTLPVRALWLVIYSQGVGIKQFALSMLIEMPDLGS